jgi:superfamily II DNA helicase RecQ
MDIPNIDLVIQFMVAHSLSVLVQRFGRAGRLGQPAVAILFAEPSVFQVKKKNNVTKLATVAEPEDHIKDEPIDDNDLELPLEAPGLDDTGTEVVLTEYKKKTEIGMQDWCLALGCRWDVSDRYFDNPPRPDGPTIPLCCDNCLRGRRNNSEAFLTNEESNILTLIDRIENQISPRSIKEVIDVDTLVTPAETPKRPGPRRTERLQSCRDALTKWRGRTWSEKYSDCAWGPNVLLSDAIVTKLATRSHLSTIEDIRKEIPEWDFVDDYGRIVLDLIRETDETWKEVHARRLQLNKEGRKRRSLENKEQREEERRTKKRAETVQRTTERTWINTYSQPTFIPCPPSTSSHTVSQPIFFVPGYYPQTQWQYHPPPHAESRPLSPAVYQTTL